MIYFTSNLHLVHENVIRLCNRPHNNTDAEYWPLIAQSKRVLNAGVDIIGFRPVTFNEMVHNNTLHKQRSLENAGEGV